MDFVQDRTVDGRPLRMLVVIDEHTRECLALDVGRRCPGEDIVMVLDELTAIRGAPAHIRSDNGPEFIPTVLKRWCKEAGTDTLNIDPGSPWLNGIVESFNGRLRDELLSSEIFETLAEARYLVDRRRLHYSHRRLQCALGKRTPAAYAASCRASPALRLASLRCAAAPPGPEETPYHPPTLTRGGPVQRTPVITAAIFHLCLKSGAKASAKC